MPSYKPVRPLIVDPRGIDPGIAPRPMGKTTGQSRAYTAQSTGYPIDELARVRDWAQPYESNSPVEDAWLGVYAKPGPENDLYQLAETLIALADQLSQYRWRHFVSVQRIIGLKPGTGGSAGVGWLQHVTEHRFFPELWNIRTRF